MLIDTHAHLYAKEFEEDREEMLQRAVDTGIERIYLPNIDNSSIEGMLALEKAYPNICFPMMGLHPCYVKDDYKEQLAIVRSWLDKRDFVAIGEIGIDLYWDKTTLEQQKDAFRTQISWAKEFNRPIVIHARESLDIIIDIIREEKTDRLNGIFHCFTGTIEQANAIIELGFYMGIGGVLTFKKAGLDKVVKDIPLSSLVLETDAPYLSPTPRRGKRNESAYVQYVAKKLAIIKDEKLETIETITTQNAKNVFSL